MHANTGFLLCGRGRKRFGEGVLGGGGGREGDDTSRTDRKTGGRRWEMERKGERKESKKELQCLVLI